MKLKHELRNKHKNTSLPCSQNTSKFKKGFQHIPWKDKFINNYDK